MLSLNGENIILTFKSCFKILDHASTYSQLKLKESFHIEQLKPELNKQVEHVSLSLHF